MNRHLICAGAPRGAWEGAVSAGGAEACELYVCNLTSENFLLAWILSTGELRSSFRIVRGKPSEEDPRICPHLEYTFVGHSFVCFRAQSTPPRTLADIADENFLFVFTAHAPKARHTVIISSQSDSASGNLRGTRSRTSIALAVDHAYEPPVDTTNKIYEERQMAGFKLFCETNVFEETESLMEKLSQDLEAVARLLPPSALSKLQASVPIWLNKSLLRGPRSHPIDEQKAMYHSREDESWLVENGMHKAKKGCVEICNASFYLSNREYWGLGGLLVHELSHAFHDQFCPQGFECPEVTAAFQRAMDRKLYDSVQVHGPQGESGPIRHYACTNSAEFFAELSTAFHWHENDTTEYNKWFPFNRHQLAQHDPETFACLQSLWKD